MTPAAPAVRHRDGRYGTQRDPAGCGRGSADAEHGRACRARVQRGLLEGRRDGQIADLRRRPDHH